MQTHLANPRAHTCNRSLKKKKILCLCCQLPAESSLMNQPGDEETILITTASLERDSFSQKYHTSLIFVQEMHPPPHLDFSFYLGKDES